jgi:hypothetical protein
MTYIHICALGFISGKRKALIPWAKLTVDLTAWIDKECYPPDFKWADLSKNQISDVFQLFDHWRHQRQSGLAPIIWNSSCDILTDIERPICVRMRPIRDPCSQGDCRGRNKTILTEKQVNYSPAEEGIRLRDIFPSSAGYTNLTKQLPNKETPPGALYRHIYHQ